MSRWNAAGGDHASDAPRQDQDTLHTRDCADAEPGPQVNPASPPPTPPAPPPQGMFGPEDFDPTWPTPGTLDSLALEMLLTGAKVTHPEFQTLTGSWRMAACVDRLRHEHHWPILTAEIPAPTRRRPRRVIGEYSMRPDALSAVRKGAA